jgi:hypothetical protein
LKILARKIVNFFSERYWLFLLLVTIISFGQTLLMGVWMDDQGMFFKLAHIQEAAGFMGKGPLGEGLYKYVVTPFIPIHQIFGYDPKWYFLLGLLVYYLSVLVVYHTFTEVLGKKGGRLSGFLYSCGFIASDAIIRLITSILTSVSIITSSFLLLFYWKFYKQRKFIFYLLALLFYFLSVEFAQVRTHYLIIVVIAIEVIFFMFKKPIARSLFSSLVRLLPFYWVFNHFLAGNIAKTGGIGPFIHELLRGRAYEFYGFLSTLVNLFLNTQFLDFSLIKPPTFVFYLTILILVLILSWVSWGKQRLRKLFVGGILIFLILWLFVSRAILKAPVLNLNEGQLFGAFLAGILPIFGVIAFRFTSKEYRQLYLLFVFWICVNLAAYAVATPLVTYSSESRYLAHSFLPLVGLLGIIFVEVNKRKSPKLKWIGTLIILWGLINLVSAVVFQRNILVKRTWPAMSFFEEFEGLVPSLRKGDVLYFDVSKNDWNVYVDAVAVASMPETTSFAWRYQIDRDDINLFTDFPDLVDYLRENPSSLGQLHTFYYSDGKLTDTTKDFLNALESPHPFDSVFKGQISLSVDGTDILLKKPISALTTSEVLVGLVARPLPLQEIVFPYGNSRETNRVFSDLGLRNLAFNYQRIKYLLRSRSVFRATSAWRDELPNNLGDGDLNTVWRPDRTTWLSENTDVVLDIGEPHAISCYVWVNAYPNSTPTKYAIYASQDSKSWVKVLEKNKTARMEADQLEVVTFPSTKGRYWKMEITETLNQDAPGISEIWLTPPDFDSLDILSAEDFLSRPFSYLPDPESYSETLRYFEMKNILQVYWFSGKTGKWETDNQAALPVVYSGRDLVLKFRVPAGGITLDKLRFAHHSFPGSIQLKEIKMRQLGLDELKQK